MSFFEKCVECGCFIGIKNHVISSLMGSYGDLEPPEFDFLCLTCWDSKDSKNKDLLYKVSYLKPIIWRNGIKYRYSVWGGREERIR